jgi:uncharacterized protein YndB with AHSA1/START domain
MAQHTSHITIQAPAMNVWQALTDPTLVKRWQYGSDLVTDWQPGHGIRFHSEWQGQVYEQWGTVLEFAPHRRIRYSLFAPRPACRTRLRTTLSWRIRWTKRTASQTSPSR